MTHLLLRAGWILTVFMQPYRAHWLLSLLRVAEVARVSGTPTDLKALAQRRQERRWALEAAFDAHVMKNLKAGAEGAMV